MKQSLTYYITLLVIKLKGVKKDFSNNPIDFKKIRKEDVYQPNGGFFKKNILRTFKISDTTITEIGVNKKSNNLLIFIHGGAFISGPAQHHWDAVKEIATIGNYAIVFDKSTQSNILFANSRYDKSDQVLKKLGYESEKE